MKLIRANIVLLSICMLLITLSACKQIEESHDDIDAENEQQDISYSFNNPNTGQEFNIIHVYLLYENYFEAVKDNPDEPTFKLYQQEIVKPVYEACFKDAELSNANSVDLFEWIPRKSEFDKITNQIQSMNKDHLNGLFEESLVKSSDILSTNKETTVCVFPKSERSTYEMQTIGTGKIIVFYSRLHKYYQSGMSHEYHHSVWMEKHHTENYFPTGLDYLLLEGQAVMFETLVYPNLNSSYHVVDESFNNDYWNKVKPYLESVATREFQEMVIDGTDGLPHSYGYSEGYKMIRSYLDLHPNMTVEEWTSKSPKEIFEEVDYKANYQGGVIK